MTDTATPRQAARLLIVDPDSRAVLLFQYDDHGSRWWATPGGGLEGDETFEQAAVREAAEELGMTLPELVPLWEATVDFSFRGNHYHQHERYFLIRVAPREMSPGEAEIETRVSEGIVDARWWSVDEIEATPERVFPLDLAQRVRELESRAG